MYSFFNMTSDPTPDITEVGVPTGGILAAPTSKMDIIIAAIIKHKYIVMGFISMIVLILFIGLISGGDDPKPAPGPRAYGPPMAFQYPQYPQYPPQYGPQYGPQPMRPQYGPQHNR